MTDGSSTDVAAGLEVERDVRIHNGQVVHIRPIRPDDAALLVAFHDSLSPQSVYLRFFNFHPVLTAWEVERFTHVDYVDRLALVVLAEGRFVGVGRYDRVVGADEAEVAFVVEDGYQRQGIGALLADELARAARAQGIRVFVADTLAENAAMLEMFHRMGFPVESWFQEGVVKVRFPIEPVPSYVESLARREATRLIGVGHGAGTSC